MATNVFIFHGVGGYPQENWFPWLKEELERLGCSVFVPQFPALENQTLEKWLSALGKYEKELSSSPILIGHSLGAPFLLNVLEKRKAHASFLVAGFTGKAGNDFDEGMKSFAQREFDWKRIKKNCPNFYVFHSDNDPYIKLEKARELAKNLGVEPKIVKGAGHFNAKAGYTRFELLLEKVKGEI